MYNEGRKFIKNKKIIKKKNSHEDERFIGLTYGERISRILLIIGILSAILEIFKRLFYALQSSFNVVYVNSKIPLGLEHFLIPVLIADVAIIFLVGFVYCFTELFNFTIYKNKFEMINYQKRADKYFKRLLGTTILSLIATVLILFLLEFIFTFNWIVKWLIGATYGVAIIVIIVMMLKNKKKIHMPRVLRTFELGKDALLYISGVWLLIVIFFWGIGASILGNSQKSNAQIKFDSEKGLVINAQFNNKEPEEVVIQSDANKTESIKICKDDFYKAFVEATKENESSKFDVSPSTNQFVYKKSYYEYRNKTDITKLLKNGKNTIVLTFKVKGLSIDSYKLVNQINYENGKITMIKNDYVISLD